MKIKNEDKSVLNLIKQAVTEVLNDKKVATKKDLESFATKKDLESFATKKDLESFATKKDLIMLESRLDLKMVDLEQKFESKVVELKSDFCTEIDPILKEVVASREDRVVASEQHHRNEERIEKLEKIHPQGRHLAAI
jgi:hypothetical protein